MKITTKKLLPVWGAALSVALFLVGVAAWSWSQSEVDAQVGSGHLITIYDRGEQKAVLSNGETIADALNEAGVEVDARDAVEPALTEKLVATEYNVNIYRARPVIVVDGAVRERVMTAHQTPEQIIKDAGISVHPEDMATLARSNDLIGDGAGLQLTVDRATPYTFELYGSTSEARTQATTIGEMLKLKNITLQENDRVSPDATTRIQPGMSVRVWREGKQTITVEEAVAFDTEQIRDADRPASYKQVQTPGQDGKRNVTYVVDVVNGQEVSRQEIASLVTTEPVKQVEVIGTKPQTMPYTGGGSRTEWLSASNIPQQDWGHADWLVAKESGWNPNAVNRSSGACGLAQALPCSKVGSDPYNPVVSLNWMNNYVNGRYGGWAGAVQHSQAKGWY